MQVVHHRTVCIYPCLPAGHTHTASVHLLVVVTENSAVSLQFKFCWHLMRILSLIHVMWSSLRKGCPLD
jgi:hypothetical protein